VKADASRPRTVWSRGCDELGVGTDCNAPGLSATLLGQELDARREQLRVTLPIRRVVGSAEIAALAVELMSNPAVTGATFDSDGGQ